MPLRTQRAFLHHHSHSRGPGATAIGLRLVLEAGDKALKDRMVRMAKSAKDGTQTMVQAQAVHTELLERLKAAC